MSAFSVTVAESEAVRVPAPALAALVATIFERVGVPPVDAHLAAAALVDADLRGVNLHGVSYLLPDYVQGCRTGAINPTPAWRVVRETPATASVDGDRGLGVVLGPQAMAIAIGKARQTGVGMVTVQHAGHLGMAQHHAMLALPHDMIGVALAATEPLMVPTFGRDSRLGTSGCWRPASSSGRRNRSAAPAASRCTARWRPGSTRSAPTSGYANASPDWPEPPPAWAATAPHGARSPSPAARAVNGRRGALGSTETATTMKRRAASRLGACSVTFEGRSSAPCPRALRASPGGRRPPTRGYHGCPAWRRTIDCAGA